MSLTEALLAELDYEMANTRKTLERVPEDKMDWRPHERSWTLGELATHIANIPSWTPMTLEHESFDLAEDDSGEREAQSTVAGLLDVFDTHLAKARQALRAAADEELGKPWKLLHGGEEIFTMPRAVVLRSMIFNHSVHHRGQLTVYLRMTGAKVPALYGPSADEEGM